MFDLLDALGHKGGEVLDVDASVRPFPQVQPPLVVLTQQVPDLVPVDFNIGGSHQVLFVLGPCNVREDVAEGVWDDALLVRILTLA